MPRQRERRAIPRFTGGNSDPLSTGFFSIFHHPRGPQHSDDEEDSDSSQMSGGLGHGDNRPDSDGDSSTGIGEIPSDESSDHGRRAGQRRNQDHAPSEAPRGRTERREDEASSGDDSSQGIRDNLPIDRDRYYGRSSAPHRDPTWRQSLPDHLRGGREVSGNEQYYASHDDGHREPMSRTITYILRTRRREPSPEFSFDLDDPFISDWSSDSSFGFEGFGHEHRGGHRRGRRH